MQHCRLMVFSRQSLFWALGSPWERQSTLNPTDFILNHCCHIFPSAKRRFPPGKEKNSCSLENLLNPMICKERRWQATWVLLPGVLLSFGFPHLPGIFGGTVPWEDMESLTPSSVISRQPLITDMQNRRMFLMFIWPALFTLQNSLTRRGIFFFL